MNFNDYTSSYSKPVEMIYFQLILHFQLNVLEKVIYENTKEMETWYNVMEKQ